MEEVGCFHGMVYETIRKLFKSYYNPIKQTQIVVDLIETGDVGRSGCESDDEVELIIYLIELPWNCV